jgi:hypothetical protein
MYNIYFLSLLYATVFHIFGDKGLDKSCTVFHHHPLDSCSDSGKGWSVFFVSTVSKK